MKIRCATFHLVATRQDAFALTATFDAALHDLPDLQQTRIDLSVAAPMPFVAPHDLGNGHVLALAELEQLIARVKRMGQDVRVRCDLFLQRAIGGERVADHESAPDRVIDACGQFTAIHCIRSEAHAVGMQRQRLATIEDEILLLIERDLATTEQHQALLRADLLQVTRHRIDVYGIGFVS